eukprot:s1476_g4.t5
MSACKHPRLALSSASSDSVIRSLPSWRWPSVVLMWSLWDFRLRSPLCSLALCVLAYSTPSADLHVWHRIAFSPSKLLLTFSAPEVEAGSTSHRLELQLHALQLRLLSPPLCSLVAASTSFTSCSLTDTRSLAFDLAEVPSNDTNWIELEAENLAPAAIRSCEGRAALGGSFFVKIGGSLNESTASADSLDTDVDKCCRQDFGTCHTFATLEECELEKWAVECYSCEVNGDALGCPEFPSEVDGYFIHSDETACASTPISSSTASSVSDCAASCRATTGCQGFSLSAGTCSLVPTCCPGDAVPESDSFSFAAADCGQNVWQFSLVLRWQTPEGTAAAFDYGTKDVSGPGRLPLLPRSFAGLRGFVSSFTAAITPDVGLTPTGSSVTLELNFQSPAGFGLGDVLTFAPLPLSPFSLDVLADTSIVEVAGTSARLIYTDLPGSVDCVWFRVGGFRVNGVKCTAGADFSISPGQQPFSLRLELPMPMYGLSADWVLALEASATGRGSVAFAADVLALTPPARLQQLRSAVQAAGTQTTVELAVQLGLWAGQVDVFITAPSLALRDVTSCTAAPGSALLAVEVAVWDGIGCRLTQVSNPHPPSEIRLRLDAENRGTVAGTRDVLTMMINWASRTHFAAAREAYSIVPEFGGELGNPAAGAVLAFSVRGTVSPLTVHFPTATDTAYYATCAADMHLQLSLMRDQLLVLRSASGSPLTAKEDAECAEVLLEVYGSTEFPAPISCSWDSMTQKGDAINMAFGNSVGLPTPETGQWYAFVLLAEILGVQADSSAALGLTLRCGNEALESSPLDLREPAGALQLQGLGSAAVLEVVSGSTTQMTLKGLLSGAAQKLRFVFLPSFGSRAWSAEGSPAVASVDYWSNADAAGQPAGSQSISGVGLTFIDTSGLPATVLDLQIPGSWTSMRSLRVSLTLADATLSQGLATGFAAHSYVWAELRRSTSSDVAKLQSASFSSPPSELRGLQIVPSSLMGGASQELELLLRLGFVARGISLQVTPPAGFLIAGHGPTPSGPAYRRLPGVRRDTPLPVLPSGTPSSGAVTLTVPGTTVLWQASTYTYSMNVQNPASMTSQNVWNVQLQLSASFPDASMPVTVQKEISSDDGAFPVVMALQHCSLAPSSMLLGARQQIQVFFTVPSGLDVSSPSQPLALRLLAPAAFFFSEVQFQPLQGLPPAMAGGTGSACSVLLPTEVRCMLPLGFAFNSGAYGFQVTVANPSQTESLQASAYQPGWALRLESSDAEPLLSICEDIPRSPSDNLPFPLYLREMEQRIFSVVFAGAAGAGQSVAVVAVFQVSAVPAGAWLTLRSPGWSWQPELGVETRSSFLLRGTTHNLPAANADEASVLAGNPAALSLQLADALQGGRVYGLQAYILTPSARQPYDRWSAELSGTAEADLVSVTNYEAAIGSFSNMRVPAVSDCAVLPFSLQAGQTPVLVSFTRASRLNPGDYLQILLPPNIQGEEPCRSFLDGAEPFYPELSLFGHVYPVFVPLPENTTCEWTTSGGRPALRLYHRATTSADAASHLISIAVRVPSGQQAQAQNIWEIGTFTGGGTVLDTSCSLTAPFELIDAQVDMVAASALQAQWTSDTSKSTLFVGFELSRQAPAAVLLRAPFGLRTAGARCSAGLRLQGAPGGYSNFPVGNRVVTCLAGGGDGSAFSSRAAPLLEGIVEVEVIGATLLAGTRYALGIELYIPAGLLYQNSWFLAVGNQVAALEGADLMRVETAEVQASFPGLALRSAGPLPYNDVQVRLTFGANVSAAASMLIAIPPIFVVVTEERWFVDVNNRLLTAELVDTCLCLWVHVVYVGHTFNGLAMASAGEVDAHEAPPEPACGDPELATEPSGGMAHMPADSEDLTGASREATADGKTSEKAKGSGKAEVAAPADIAGISREATAAADARPGPSEKEEKLQSRPEDKQREIARPVQSLTGVEAASDENGAAASVPPQATNPGPSLDKQVASEPEAGDHGHHGPSRPMLSTGTSDSSPQEPLLQAQAPRSSSAPEDVPVVITREEVAEAVEDMRRYGASLVRPVADAMEATRAHGAVALERGAEAASEARRQGNAALQSSVETAEALRKAGVQAAQTSAEMIQQGTEVARANWQHGAEACQRGMDEASAAWRRAAPYVDKAILLVNVACALAIGGFLTLGIMLACKPLKPSRMHHGAFDRMFWVTQGLYLVAFSIPALVATVQCGILRNGFENWPMKFQVGRAVFFIGAGFYVFPLMANFGLAADVELWTVILSYLLGILSLLSGSFLLIFEGLLSVYIRQALYDRLAVQTFGDPGTIAAAPGMDAEAASGETASSSSAFNVESNVAGQREIDADYPLSFMVARLSSIHEKRVQTAVKVFEAAKEDAVCKQKSAMRFSTKETRFNDLIMVAMLSNLSHIFEIGGNTVTNHVSMIVLWVIMIQSLHSVSFVVNLWNMDDLFTLLCCFGTTLGSVWMAAAARPSVVEMSVGVQASQKRELRLTVKSDVHPPCTAAWVDTPRYVQRFDCGALISQASQIAISTQAAIFNENARDHVDTWWQIVVVAVMLIANVCIALVIVFLACKMAYPALVEYHYGSLVVSRSTLQKYRLLHVVARVNLLSLKCRTAEHDVQMNSPMMYAASTKVYDSPRASCLHHKCINCCIHLAPSALQCRTLRAHVHLEVLLHRKYVIVAAFCASSYFICWKFTTVMELLDLQHLRGEWVITCIIREIDLISLISQTSLDLMLAAEYFNTKQHGDESHDLAKLSLQAVDKNAYGSAVLEFLGIYTAVCHCHVFVLLASIGERGYRHAAVQGERPRTCRSSQPSHVILVGFSGQLRHRVWLDDECASMALSVYTVHHSTRGWWGLLQTPERLSGGMHEHILCSTGSTGSSLTRFAADEVDQVWLLKGAEYIVTLRVQNPATCHSCSPAWQIFLKEQVTWSSEAQGFHLVGEVADFVVEPSHRLGDSSVLLTVMIHLAGRLLLQDRVVFTVPSGWELDPLFCESPVAQAAMVGLKAPPSCSSNAAVLTVYEMDLPPLSSPQLQLRLEGMAPEFGLWQAKRTEWIGILAQASDANTSASAPLPFEFSVEVRRRSQSVLTVSAAGKVQAYEVMPNMAPNCELAISSASLASLAAMRLSLRPSESIDAFVNSIWIRSSLPYDFRGCSLLWEEPADRAASRPEDPVFRFAGEPRCVGQLTELTLFGVLLDTSIKDQVTVYVANFTVPRPPYAAKESRWEVALLRSRSGLEPLKKDHGIGLPGPGAFGGLLVSAWASEEQPQFSHTHLFDRADMSREPIRCESDIDSRDEPAL